MKKLVNGIVEFRKNIRPGYQETFARLALGQSPDSLFIACSDSRVVPNLFASTDPGDLFVIRNVGNLIPCCGDDGHSSADESEAAAIELAILNLKVSNIIVCGHSECAAMNAIHLGRENVAAPNLRAWLRHGEVPMEKRSNPLPSEALSPANQLSQLNVLHQIDNLKTYPVVRERLEQGKLRMHAWWFELRTAEVYAYEEDAGRFVVIDEVEAERILARL